MPRAQPFPPHPQSTRRPRGPPDPPVAGRGTHGAPHSDGSLQNRGGAAEGADVSISSGREFAAFRLRGTDRTERARSGRGWRETNGARRTPAVGCTRQGFPRPPRAKYRSRVVAAARRAGPAPRRADPRRDPPAETGEARARRADVVRDVCCQKDPIAPNAMWTPALVATSPPASAVRRVPTRAGQYCFTRHMPLGGRWLRRFSRGGRRDKRSAEGHLGAGRFRDVATAGLPPREQTDAFAPRRQANASVHLACDRGSRGRASPGPSVRPPGGASANSRSDGRSPQFIPDAGRPSAREKREDSNPARLRARRERLGALPRARKGRPATAAAGGMAAAKGGFRRGKGHRGTAGDPSRAPTACRHAAGGVVAFRVVTPLYTLNRIPPFATRSTKPLRKQALFLARRDGRPNDLGSPPNFARMPNHHGTTLPQNFVQNARAVREIPLRSGPTVRARARARARRTQPWGCRPITSKPQSPCT